MPDDMVTDEMVTDDTGMLPDEMVTEELVSDNMVTEEMVPDDKVKDEMVTDEMVTDGRNGTGIVRHLNVETTTDITMRALIYWAVFFERQTIMHRRRMRQLKFHCKNKYISLS